MIYFIELWNPTEKWLSLNKSDRANYLQKIGEATVALIEQGVEVLTWSVNDEDIHKRGGFDYFAIWKFPSEELSIQFQEAVSNAGWYEYFEQINMQGKQDSAQNVLEKLIKLDAPVSKL